MNKKMKTIKELRINKAIGEPKYIYIEDLKEGVIKWIKEDFSRSKGYNKAFEDELNLLTSIWMRRFDISKGDLKNE